MQSSIVMTEAGKGEGWSTQALGFLHSGSMRSAGRLKLFFETGEVKPFEMDSRLSGLSITELKRRKGSDDLEAREEVWADTKRVGDEPEYKP